MMTHGTPGSVTPSTFNPGAVRWTIHHVDGKLNSRCGSLARIGLPDAVCEPATAHAFEPGEISAPVRGGNKYSTFALSPRSSIDIFVSSCFQVVVRLRYICKPAKMVSVTVHGFGW